MYASRYYSTNYGRESETTRAPKRALLSLATGAGKTRIAVNLLKRCSDAGALTKALFVCDRDELRTQALAACEIRKGRVSLDDTGITKAQILALHPVDAITGRPLSEAEIDELYEKTQFEDRILLPDRVLAMCSDLFSYLLETGGPEQKSIVFCARDRHADDVAVCMNNLYASWCAKQGRFVVADVDGKAMPIPLEEYKDRMAERLVREAASLEDFRRRWIDPLERRELLDALVGSGYSPSMVRTVEEKGGYDLYDLLAELGWGLSPRTRGERVNAFIYKHEDWIDALPKSAAYTIRAIARQFERGGTEGLENPQVLRTPEVKAAGGLEALRQVGEPKALLSETKARMFAA